MANLTFKANLLPNSDLGYSLGSTTQEWAVYGILTGTASNAIYSASAAYSLNAASSTYANSTNCASHAIHSGSATYATSAAQATHSASATFANSAISASQAVHSASANYSASAAQATHSASAAFASSATKATQDGSGNTITSTYLKLSGGTMTGNITLSSSDTGIIQKLKDTSNWGLALSWNKATAYTTTYRPGIGFHNTGTSISIVPYSTNTDPWGGTVGLFISNNALKWENKVILHSGNYSSYAATSGHSHSYLPLSGGTMTGSISMGGEYVFQGKMPRKNANGGGWAYTPFRVLDAAGSDFAHFGVFGSANSMSYIYIGANDYDSSNNFKVEPGGTCRASKLYGAVWNDYAEYRKDNPEENQESGHCVKEIGNGILGLTTKRLERGCEIISDTFGFAIGQDEENGYNTPIASSGRVLAYPYENIEEFSQHIGWPVCSGPNGTVSIMTEEEEEKYPSRIIGTISEIPTYETWGTGNVKVNGRIWIRIR